MNGKPARWGAVLVHAAPLLGVPLWLVQMQRPSNSWNFPLMFALGLFMLAPGFVIPLVVLFAARHSLLRTNAVDALRFHSAIGILGLGLAVAFVIAVQFDPPNPTMDNPPAYSGGVLMIVAFVFGMVLPVVELVRSIIFGVRGWRA
jgi:hypothetical protein